MSDVSRTTSTASADGLATPSRSVTPPPVAELTEPERLEVMVIGGSQAGLAMGYELAQRGRRFVILDAGAHIGDARRTRYDSLVLFTPAQYNHLPGLPFPR